MSTAEIAASPAKLIDLTGTSRRLRARCVDIDTQARKAIARAAEAGRPVVRATHGGAVANSYGYTAETEGAVTVGFPDGHSVTWLARLPANKVSLSGVVAACTGFRGLFDDRFGKDKQAACRSDIIAAAESHLA